MFIDAVRYEITDETGSLVGVLEYEAEDCYAVKIDTVLSIQELQELLKEVKRVFKKPKGGQDGK